MSPQYVVVVMDGNYPKRVIGPMALETATKLAAGFGFIRGTGEQSVSAAPMALEQP
jgi:hypothetical protein